MDSVEKICADCGAVWEDGPCQATIRDFEELSRLLDEIHRAVVIEHRRPAPYSLPPFRRCGGVLAIFTEPVDVLENMFRCVKCKNISYNVLNCRHLVRPEKEKIDSKVSEILAVIDDAYVECDVKWLRRYLHSSEKATICGSTEFELVPREELELRHSI